MSMDSVQTKQVIEQLRKATMKIGRKPIVKKGTLQLAVVETTPVVWKGRLLRFEWIRNNHWGPMEGITQDVGYYRFVDMEKESPCCEPFAFDHAFGCCYAEGDVMYVQGVRGEGGGNVVDCFKSMDLMHWEKNEAIVFPEDIEVYNTSVCKSPDGYTMAIELGGDNPVVGIPYTCVFAKSTDLMNWEVMPMEEFVYTRERYSACPSIRYYDGYYYIVYLEASDLNRCVPYIVRTSTLREFEYETAVCNPIMHFSDEDKQFVRPEKFTEAEKEYILNAVNVNNSDVDFCEYNGRTIITYSWGNQLGKEFLGLAEYEGSEKEFLESFFE